MPYNPVQSLMSSPFLQLVGDVIEWRKKGVNPMNTTEGARPYFGGSEVVQFPTMRGARNESSASDTAQTSFSMPARPYQGVSNELMGFKRNGPQTGYENSNYPMSVKVRVHLPESTLFGQKIGGEHIDEIKGMNKAHALERAYRNWPNASKIEIIE
jgi:hypothetical protein